MNCASKGAGSDLVLMTVWRRATPRLPQHSALQRPLSSMRAWYHKSLVHSQAANLSLAETTKQLQEEKVRVCRPARASSAEANRMALRKFPANAWG